MFDTPPFPSSAFCLLVAPCQAISSKHLPSTVNHLPIKYQAYTLLVHAWQIVDYAWQVLAVNRLTRSNKQTESAWWKWWCTPCTLSLKIVRTGSVILLIMLLKAFLSSIGILSSFRNLIRHQKLLLMNDWWEIHLPTQNVILVLLKKKT